MWPCGGSGRRIRRGGAIAEQNVHLGETLADAQPQGVGDRTVTVRRPVVQHEDQLAAPLLAGELPVSVELGLEVVTGERQRHLIPEGLRRIVDLVGRRTPLGQPIAAGRLDGELHDGAQIAPFGVGDAIHDIELEVIHAAVRIDRQGHALRREHIRRSTAYRHIAVLFHHGNLGCRVHQIGDPHAAQPRALSQHEELAARGADEVSGIVDVNVRITEQGLPVLLVVHVQQNGPLGIARGLILGTGYGPEEQSRNRGPSNGLSEHCFVLFENFVADGKDSEKFPPPRKNEKKADFVKNPPSCRFRP